MNHVVFTAFTIDLPADGIRWMRDNSRHSGRGKSDSGVTTHGTQGGVSPTQG